MLTSISGKIDNQTKILNEIGQNVCAVGNDVIKTQKKSDDVYNIVNSRIMLRETQNARDLAKELFRPNQSNAQQTPICTRSSTNILNRRSIETASDTTANTIIDAT